MEYESIEKIDKKENIKKRDFMPTSYKILGLFSIIYFIIVLGLRIAEFVISIINISSGYKIFYLLSIIIFVLSLLIVISIFLSFSFSTFILKFILSIIMISSIGIDGTCYFLYFYEEINVKSLFVLLIISDVIN